MKIHTENMKLAENLKLKINKITFMFEKRFKDLNTLSSKLRWSVERMNETIK